MTGCREMRITDRAFSNLGALRELYMGGCTQKEITNKGLSHLESIEVLDIHGSKRITGEGFAPLKDHLRELNIGHCNQFKDKDFKNLQGLEVLDISYCEKITDKALEALDVTRLQTLNISGCPQFSSEAIEALQERAPDLDLIDEAY
jgi:Leucine-rich repeat (LRR) protein